MKPGKGGAFAQVEMKAIADGTKLNERFRSDEKLEKAHVEPRKMQYLYPEGEDLVFMDLETYEQLNIAGDEIAEQKGYLTPNIEVQINFYNNNPIGLDLPSAVTDPQNYQEGKRSAPPWHGRCCINPRCCSPMNRQEISIEPMPSR